MDEEYQMDGYNKYNRYNSHYNRYGRSYDSYRMNGEQYCESEFMVRNEQGCRSSSCCHWNTQEQGDASFNGEGRCWSRIGQDMCFDMDEEYQMDGYNKYNRYNGHYNRYGRSYDSYRMNGEHYCESDFMIRNEQGCRASSCCHWNTQEQGDASFNGEGRCWSRIGQDMCSDTDERYNMQSYNQYNRYKGHYNRYGRNFDSFKMSGEQYCESEHMKRN